MKHYLSAVLSAAIMASLTACGGGAPQAASSTESASPSPSPTNSLITVPEVAGKPIADAKTALTSLGLYVVILGKDGKKWSKSTVPDKTVVAVSTDPAAGGLMVENASIEVTVNLTEDEQLAATKAAAEAANGAAEAAKLATRYTFDCGARGDYSTTNRDVYHSLKEVWASKHYAGPDVCWIHIDGKGIYDHPFLIPSEKAIADVVAAHGGGGGGSASSDFGRVLELCSKLEPGYADKVVARMDWKKAEAQGALALCPDAPHAPILQGVITSVKIDDGTKVVGKTMEPGTYKTKPSSKDCYWSRTTGGGAIIENDFVGFAPDGVTVTVYAGEGFESQGCGVWTKIG